MECVEAALKTSFRKEMGVKLETLSPEMFSDDFPAVVNGQNGVSADEYFVDDFLDLSDENGFVETESDEEKKLCFSVSENPLIEGFSNGVLTELTSEFSVPTEDLADLEWVSHFVDDSFSEYSPAYFTGTLIETPKLSEPSLTPLVPAKARSKRGRTGNGAGSRIWSIGCPPLSESSSSSTSSTSSSTIEPVSSGTKPAAKKQRKISTADFSGGAQAQQPRRCSHCGVQKTPQWRAGPLGAKTLCNACGVRFKSGRLLPEYRPACSPTFSTELHSNHHRKVLEMRRNKEGLSVPVEYRS